MWSYILLAQVPPALDPLAGGGGWVGAGLLGSVLGWLLFVHLPNKDKQIAGLIDSRDKLVKEVSADFKAAMDAMVTHLAAQEKDRREEFKGHIEQIIASYEKEITMVGNYLRKDLDELSHSLATFNRNFPGQHETTQKGA